MRRFAFLLSIGFIILGMISVATTGSQATAAPLTAQTAVTVKQQAAAPASVSSMPAVSDAYCRARRWGYGSTGPCVQRIQHLFNYVKDDYSLCGMSPRYSDLAEDGGYGDKTYSAIRYLQTHCGYTVDGIVGPQTWGALVAFG